MVKLKDLIAKDKPKKKGGHKTSEEYREQTNKKEPPKELVEQTQETTPKCFGSMKQSKIGRLLIDWLKATDQPLDKVIEGLKELMKDPKQTKYGDSLQRGIEYAQTL